MFLLSFMGEARSPDADSGQSQPQPAWADRTGCDEWTGCCSLKIKRQSSQVHPRRGSVLFSALLSLSSGEGIEQLLGEAGWTVVGILQGKGELKRHLLLGCKCTHSVSHSANIC